MILNGSSAVQQNNKEWGKRAWSNRIGAWSSEKTSNMYPRAFLHKILALTYKTHLGDGPITKGINETTQQLSVSYDMIGYSDQDLIG